MASVFLTLYVSEVILSVPIVNQVCVLGFHCCCCLFQALYKLNSTILVLQHRKLFIIEVYLKLQIIIPMVGFESPIHESL